MALCSTSLPRHLSLGGGNTVAEGVAVGEEELSRWKNIWHEALSCGAMLRILDEDGKISGVDTNVVQMSRARRDTQAVGDNTFAENFKNITTMHETVNMIKELRSRRGYSQEELAERSGLTSRTIQRIENGETEPRGDSLTRLAAALDVTVDDLVDCGATENNRFIAMMNLSALSFLVFPLLGIIVPLIIRLSKKGKVKGLNDATRSLFNFQITWIMTLIIGWIVSWPFIFTFSVSFSPDPISPLVAGVLIGIFALAIITVLWVYVFNVIEIIVNAVRASRGEKIIYRPAIKFLGK